MENKDRLILDRREMFEYLKSKRGIDEKSVRQQQIEHLQKQLKDAESSKQRMAKQIDGLKSEVNEMQ